MVLCGMRRPKPVAEIASWRPHCTYRHVEVGVRPQQLQQLADTVRQGIVQRRQAALLRVDLVERGDPHNALDPGRRRKTPEPDDGHLPVFHQVHTVLLEPLC